MKNDGNRGLHDKSYCLIKLVSEMKSLTTNFREK